MEAKVIWGDEVGREPVPNKPKADDPNKREMTSEEKQELSRNMVILPSEKLAEAVEIIKKGSKPLIKHDDEVFEVNLEDVDAETLWELDRLFISYNERKNPRQEVAEEQTESRTDADSSSANASDSGIKPRLGDYFC